MTRKFLTFAITAMLAINVALACGPQFVPRYGMVPHIDLGHGAGRNFSLLLDSYHSPSAKHEYVNSETRKRQYEDQVARLLEQSGRDGLAIFNFTRLQERFCPENTKEKLAETHREFVKQHLPRRSNRCSGDCDAWRKKHDLTFAVRGLFSHAIPGTCGPYAAPGSSRNISSIEQYDDGSPYNEYAWLALAYHHTYSGNIDEADQYIRKLAASPLEGAREQVARLKEIGTRMASATYPVAIPIHFSSGYRISWCTKESKTAALQFTKSILASNANDTEVASLVEARHLLLSAGCDKMQGKKLERFEALTSADTFTKPAADHAAYLNAARAFYEKNYGQALALVNALHESNEPWIAETTLYLSGRIPLLQSQKEWNGYSDPQETIDRERLDAAGQGFDRYLQAYPQGRFASSADGLKRKIAYLRGDDATLQAELDEKVNAAANAFIDNTNEQTYERFSRLFTEWKRHAGKDVDYATASPLIIAYDVMRNLENDLENGRKDSQKDNGNRRQSLEQAEDRFAGMERVYRLLRYMTLLQAGEHDRIVAEPVPTDFGDGVDVAIAALHAQASEAAGLTGQARSTWLAIHESSEERKAWDTVQARIAETYIQENDYYGLARKSSHVTLRKIFEDAFVTACDENTLIDIAADDSLNPDAITTARDEVFRRRIMHGDFDGLHALYDKVDNLGDFSLIETAARQTAEDPDNARGLLNLGYYMLRKMSPHRSSLPGADSDHSAGHSAGNCPMTAIEYSSPREYFYKVVELHDDGRKSVDEAKALHYLILCDKPGYRSGECNWYYSSRRNRPTGKELFQRLHDRYPDSKWAEDTPYYYD